VAPAATATRRIGALRCSGAMIAPSSSSRAKWQRDGLGALALLTLQSVGAHDGIVQGQEQHLIARQKRQAENCRRQAFRSSRSARNPDSTASSLLHMLTDCG
jgi:hypothetical protein